MATAFITHPDCWMHSMGAMHPECPDRLSAIQDELIGSGLDSFLRMHDAVAATHAQLERVHTAQYVQDLFAAVPDKGIRHLDPDTAMCPHTLRAALRAAGAGILATDLVMRGEVENAFCSVRPPGHHAERARAMGFCFFNNIAIAAAHALEAHGLSRVAIVDFDVHHGNGTEHIFAGDERVLMVGVFQHPFYPYSGAGNTAPNMLNVPIPAGTRGDAFREIVSEVWMPALRDFAPQALFVSAGFDAHYEDDMASCGLVEADYAFVTRALTDFARAHCQGRIVSMLEGGYALPALARSVLVHVRALSGL